MAFRGGGVVVGCCNLGRFFRIRLFGYRSEWGCWGEKFLAFVVHVTPPGGAGGRCGGVGPICGGYFCGVVL